MPWSYFLQAGMRLPMSRRETLKYETHSKGYKVNPAGKRAIEAQIAKDQANQGVGLFKGREPTFDEMSDHEQQELIRRAKNRAELDLQTRREERKARSRKVVYDPKCDVLLKVKQFNEARQVHRPESG
jgi:hypothetical protein